MRRTWVAAGLVCVACARIRPLEGGPPDRDPPRLVLAAPADSTRGLTGKPVFELTWSERIDPASLRGAIRFQPPLRIASVEVHGTRTRITLADSLPDDTTVVLIVGRALRDAVPRNNALPAEIVLSYATGREFRAASVFGQVTVQGRVDPRAAVVWQPLVSDSLPSRRARLPAAAVDGEGRFHLAGLPADVPGRLVGFLDRNRDLHVDEDEFAVAFSETLRLAPSMARRGVQWNIVDPHEAGTLRGVVQNRSRVAGPIAIAIRARADSASLDSTVARVDTLAAAPARTASPYAAAYDALDPRGYVRREWVVVYASPRGDYSMKVPPGRHPLVAFVDARRDSTPGVYTMAETQALAWEPLLWADHVEIEPGGVLRFRTLEIGASRGADAGRQ